jgi:WD40-like Beta Propeller Repeat
MRNLALVLVLSACSDPGRGRGSSSNNGGNNGGTSGGTNGSTTGGTNGSTNGGTTGTYNGPDMALPTLPFDSTVVEPGAPNDAPNKFGGAADPGAAPTVVYPPDGVLVPPNTNEIEIQFVPATGTDLFEIAFTGPNGLNLRVYTGCNVINSGCGYTPEAPVWNTLEAAARDNTVHITIRATSSAGTVGASAARALNFAAEDMEGGLYYWAAAAGAVNRYDFGRRGQTAEPFYTTAQSGAICVGCHALSRDGSRIAVGLNAPTPATLRVLDVASRNTLYESAGGFPGSPGGSNFEALSPDGTKLLTSENNNLVLHDSASGTALGPTITNANMPDWSVDGMQVVFARGGGTTCPLGICASQPGVDSASLFTIPWTGSAFGTPSQLVAGGPSTNNYYPALSPDGKWVAFNRSGMNSFDAPDAKVLVVNAAGGNAQDLTAVNTDIGNSWPKFAPFTHHFQGKTIFWLTFSSRRDYGIRLLNSQAPDKDHEVAQVWMVAVSPDRLNTPGDGGYPPFWLPFQDMSTGNHIAQWTEKVARMGCTADDQCFMGEFCVGGECVPPVK